ncbi:MAG TPA: flagellar basal-body MS-ring/collar protein FliF [Terracidiphilus sp.]|nr:flagellar basal-body MS-ring/collar protein FliF [Terracidiphilus sp.]
MATGTSQLENTNPLTTPGSILPARAVIFWTRVRVAWASMQPSQRRGSMVSAVLLTSLTGAILWYGLRTDWRTLYAGLDPEDARQAGLVLTQAQIPFDVAVNGTTIRVPAPMLDKARLATAAKGAIKSGRLGYELFDKPNWVGSEFDEQVNYQRALEGELEHTAGTLADIESARVHLVLSHDSLFRDEERPAKASVVLKLRHASLAEGEADAIRNLVASAVDGLVADRVVLVDASGRTSLGPKTAEALHLSAEQALEEKLISTLEPVTGIGNVRASVTLEYEDTSRDQTDETYDPERTATLSMQRTEETTGGQPVAAGVAGAASNAPNAQALPVYPKQVAEPQSSRSESGTYGVSKTVRHVVEEPGKVRRMTAAIVVNDRMMRAESKKSPAVWQPWSADQMRNLTSLAQAATGFDTARGDVLTVQDLAFDANRPAQPAALSEQLVTATQRAPVLVRSVVLLLGLVAVLLLGLRPALRLTHLADTRPSSSKMKNDHAQPLAEQSHALLTTTETAVVDPQRLRAQEIFEQVTGHLKREPTQSSRLLQSWIHSDEH